MLRRRIWPTRCFSRDELRYVLDPKEVMGADYPSETFRVLQKNEIAKYGEYRTARLVMAAYDRLVSEGRRRDPCWWRAFSVRSATYAEISRGFHFGADSQKKRAHLIRVK